MELNCMRALFVSDYLHLPDIKGGLQTTTRYVCLAIDMAGADVAVPCGTHEYGDTEGVRLLVEPRKSSAVWAAALRRLLAGLDALRTAACSHALEHATAAWLIVVWLLGLQASHSA